MPDYASSSSQFASRPIALAWQSSDPEVLRALVYTHEFGVKLALSHNSATPADALTQLALLNNPDINYNLLNHPNTPQPVKMWLRGGFADMSLVEFLKALAV